MELIPLEKAYEIVMDSAFLTGTEAVAFTDSAGRVLAEEIITDTDLPSFTKSTVDGYACRREDVYHELELIEIIPAGKSPEKRISADQCSKIMTGAAVPAGADYVFMVEDSRILESGKIKCLKINEKNNISKRGEDVIKGKTILTPGTLLRPQDVAVMATVGHLTVTVRKKPVVAVISSGNELIEPVEKPENSQIRNSNAYQLMAQVSRAGGQPEYYGIAPDDEDRTFAMIEKAISGSDLVLLTGGVSMGDFDFIPSVLQRAGVELLFSKVAVQPGKPVVFGKHSKSLVFGLPGNPVSSFMQFELLVRPLINMMMDYEWRPVDLIFPIKEKYSRKNADKMALVPVSITDDGFVTPVDYHGSGHISALSKADGVIAVPIGIQSIAKGEQVSVRQI